MYASETGDAEVRTTLDMLASADADLTVIVRKGELQPGFSIDGSASFTKPGETQPTEAPETYLLGDADNNGIVESLDGFGIQRYAARMSVKDRATMERNGDVDRNGHLEILDATNIQRKLAKMNVRYPIGEYVPVE